MSDMYSDCVSVEECVSACLEAVKAESGATDDNLVRLYIERSYMSICNYLWCDELPRRLIPAVGALAPAILTFAERSTKGYVSQKTQGSRSVSYQYNTGAQLDADGLTPAVKAMLPLPRLRVL